MHSLRVNNLLKPGRVEVLPAGMLSGSNIEDAWQVITLIRQFLRGYVVARYIPRHLAEKYVTAYEFKISPPYVNEDDRSGLHAVETLAGYALSAAQVYVPVRILEKELELAGEGVSVVRYVIDWAAEESTERVFGAPDFFHRY